MNYVYKRAHTKKKVIVKSKEELKEIIHSDKNADLNHLDVSRITDMSYLFLSSSFNGKIDKWDVSNVTNMCNMFAHSRFNGDISKWNVGKVKIISEMFMHSQFNGDVSNWDVSYVREYKDIFSFGKFKGDIRKWDLPNKQYNWYRQLKYTNILFKDQHPAIEISMLLVLCVLIIIVGKYKGCM